MHDEGGMRGVKHCSFDCFAYSGPCAAAAKVNSIDYVAKKDGNMFASGLGLRPSRVEAESPSTADLRLLPLPRLPQQLPNSCS